MAAALDAGIRQISVESVPELRRSSEVASREGRIAPIAIRVNADVDAHTHAKISTGRKENKFGVEIGEAVAASQLADELPGIEPVGLAVHIGSQLTDLEPYRRAFERVSEVVLELRALGLSVARLDLGGGIGVRYHAERPLEPLGYAKLVRDIFGSLGLTLAFEPGRVLTAAPGLLVSEVLVSDERFDIIRARPSYDALLSLDTIPQWLPDTAKESVRKRGAA